MLKAIRLSAQAAMRTQLARYYLRSPLRSRQFLTASLLLLIDLTMVGTILWKNWGRLPGWSVYYLGLLSLLLISALTAAYGTHKTVRRYLAAANIEKLDSGSILETGLYVASYMTQCLLVYAFAAAGVSLAALGEIFIRH